MERRDKELSRVVGATWNSAGVKIYNNNAVKLASMEGGDVRRSPFPISDEHDLIREETFSQVVADRSDWLQKVEELDPELQILRECVNPRVRAAKFAKLYLPGNKLIDQRLLLALVSQHLLTLGLVESRNELHNEWEERFQIPLRLQHSQLARLVQRGVFRAERFWELAFGLPNLTPEERKTMLDAEISLAIGGAPRIDDHSAPLEGEVVNDPRYVVVNQETGQLTRASLNQLILLLTTENEMPLAKVAGAFCLTYKSFVSSHELFGKLRERFRLAFRANDRKGGALTFHLFQKWLEVGRTEIETPVMDLMKAFAEKELKEWFPDEVGKLFEEPKHKEDWVVDYTQAPRVDLGKCTRWWTSDFSLFELPPVEIARQMTYWSCVRYYAIQRSELLYGAWQVPRLKHRSPNIVALIDHGNIIGDWVSSSILSEKSLERRLHVWGYFISVMKHLWKMQNYLDVFALNGGFLSVEIDRLKVHRSLLRKKDQEFMAEVQHCYLDGGVTLKLIRQLNQTALESQKPMLPYFGCLLSDLFRFGDIEPNKVDGLINVAKCRKTLEYIKSFEIYREQKYNILPITQVQERFNGMEPADTSALDALSFEAEPEGATEATLKGLP